MSKECMMCGEKMEGQKHFSRFDGQMLVCKPCSLAESFLRVHDYCVRGEGNTPSQCATVPVQEWMRLVAETRKRTTDAYLMRAWD